MFAVIEGGIIVDGWLADSFEEAQSDNPGKKLIELTLDDGLVQIGSTWKGN
jgi:hypothetical protein